MSHSLQPQLLKGSNEKKETFALILGRRETSPSSKVLNKKGKGFKKTRDTKRDDEMEDMETREKKTNYNT